MQPEDLALLNRFDFEGYERQSVLFTVFLKLHSCARTEVPIVILNNVLSISAKLIIFLAGASDFMSTEGISHYSMPLCLPFLSKVLKKCLKTYVKNLIYM